MHALFNFDQTSTLHALIRVCTLIHFSGFLKNFCQTFRPNLEFLVKTRYIFWKLLFIWQLSLCYYEYKFRPAHLFRTARFFRACTLIQDTRVRTLFKNSETLSKGPQKFCPKIGIGKKSGKICLLKIGRNENFVIQSRHGD